MATMTGVAKARNRSEPVRALGRWVRTVREAKGLTQREVADRAEMRYVQLSLLENGRNVEVEQYDRVAKALGFRDALEMLRAPGDPIMRRLMRYWPLLDDGARRDVLAQVKAMIDADEESIATSAGG